MLGLSSTLSHKHTHKHTKLFLCHTVGLMVPRLQFPQGQLTQSIPPPPVLHRHITAAPLKWQVYPPPPLSCFNGTSRAQRHKRLAHTYTHFLQISKPHTSRLASYRDQTDLPPHTHSTTLLVLPVINHLPCPSPPATAPHHPITLSQPHCPLIPSSLSLLSAHWHLLFRLPSPVSQVYSSEVHTGITWFSMHIYMCVSASTVCGSSFQAVVCKMGPKTPRGPGVRSRAFPAKFRRRDLMY